MPLSETGIPHDSASLIEALDRQNPPARVVTPWELADPRHLYQLAYDAGRRSVVEDLRRQQQIDQEKQRHGYGRT